MMDANKSALPKNYEWLSRLLGLVYLVALCPLFFEIAPLIGDNGLQPANLLVNKAFAHEGWRAIIHFPSLYWLYPHTITLYVLIAMGFCGAMLLIVNRNALLGAALSWLGFISICTVGGDFFVIIIDFFLCELGFLAILLHLSIYWFGYLPRIVKFCFTMLNFRLWFSMGVIKFYHPGATWLDLTFFEYFFPYQPIPTPLAYYFWHLPKWSFFLAEIWLAMSQLVVPFFMFGNKRFRLVAFACLLLTSVLIMLVGNYGYFNIVSIVAGLSLLDTGEAKAEVNKLFVATYKRLVFNSVCTLLLAMQLLYCIALTDPNPHDAQNHFNTVFLYPKFQQGSIKYISVFFKPFVFARLCNPYGVFKSIPSFRIELRFSGSNDNIHWLPYRFKYAPSANTKLTWVAPYYPRIDHLLFYETLDAGGYNYNLLNPYYTRQNIWIGAFVKKLLENDPNLSKLLADNPFKKNAPPKYIKCDAYSLTFSPIGISKTWDSRLLGTQRIYKLDSIDYSPVITQDYLFNEVVKKRTY